MTTLAAIFDDYAQAQTAVRALNQAGIKQSDISVVRGDAERGEYRAYGGSYSNDYDTGESIGDKISDFFGNLFGADDAAVNSERDLYAESVRRGSVAVVVRVAEDRIDRATDILNDNGAIDVDRRAAQYRSAGYKNYDAKSPLYTSEQAQTERRNFAEQGEVALPVIEEQLNVGKRVVQRGGVRVHTSVSEREVEETVNLREEKVTIDRRPVDRAANEADLASVKEGTFDVTTKAEVPVVEKEARVVEEVVVGKDVTERQETVSDTVRRTDVDVEQTDADDARRRSAKN